MTDHRLTALHLKECTSADHDRPPTDGSSPHCQLMITSEPIPLVQAPFTSSANPADRSAAVVTRWRSGPSLAVMLIPDSFNMSSSSLNSFTLMYYLFPFLPLLPLIVFLTFPLLIVPLLFLSTTLSQLSSSLHFYSLPLSCLDHCSIPPLSLRIVYLRSPYLLANHQLPLVPHICLTFSGSFPSLSHLLLIN